jgi:hypothetical protein
MVNGFQSIGFTKDWRPSPSLQWHASPPCCFQSIGVTKDWRRGFFLLCKISFHRFPINRRHQELATASGDFQELGNLITFPINRRHQSFATFWICWFC